MIYYTLFEKDTVDVENDPTFFHAKPSHVNNTNIIGNFTQDKESLIKQMTENDVLVGKFYDNNNFESYTHSKVINL